MPEASVADAPRAERPLASGSARKYLLLIAKLSISAALLGFIVVTEDPAELWGRVSSADPALIAAAIGILLIQFPLAAWRWGLVLDSLGQRSSRMNLLRLVWIGQFATQVLPTFVAGDALRLWYCHREGIALRTGFASIFWDRMLGFIGIAILCLVMAPHLNSTTSDRAAEVAVPALAALAIAGTVALLVVGKFSGLLTRRWPATRRLAPFFDGWQVLRHPGTSALILALATLTNVIASAATYLLARASGVDLSLIDAVTLVPAALFMSLLPISVAGWGVRELSLTYLLSLVGVASGDAVAVSVLLGGSMMVAALPGVAFWQVYSGDSAAETVDLGA